MKIHIVRKGDTLWEIANQYGVDFEQLKQFNPQLSSPDMIMPGMKIKIPSSTKSVKKETVAVKETKVPVPKEQPKQLPIVKEDDHEKPKEVKMEMPKKYIPEMPPKPLAPEKEVLPTKEIPKAPMKPMQEMMKMPIMAEELPINLPKIPQYKQPEEKVVSQQMPEKPMYFQYCHPCCPPVPHHCFPVMGGMNGEFMPHHQQMHHEHMMPMQQPPMQQMPMQHMPMQHMPMQQMPMQHMPMQQMPIQQKPMQQPPIQQMPIQQMPLQQQHMMQTPDCGCQETVPQSQHYQMQVPVPFPAANMDMLGYQPQYGEQQLQSNFQRPPSFQPNLGNELNYLNEQPLPMLPEYPSTVAFDIREDVENQSTQEIQTNEDETANK